MMFTRLPSSVLLLIATLLSCTNLMAHHWVIDAYDSKTLEKHDVEIIAFKFINPHPLIKVSPVDSDDEWILEMDNRWELADLGFSESTFKTGERVHMTLNPSPFKANAYYVRAFDHPRLEFRYEHNRRQVYPLGDSSRNLLELPGSGR